MQNLLKELISTFQNDERLIIDGKLVKNKVVELALAMDESLISLLLGNKEIKNHFFKAIGDVLVFDKVAFQSFVSNKQFLPDSYTAFKNKIGLTANGEYLTESKEVVLTWPYKDCVLEGGQTKEDQKRKEIFWNETLAPDEIDRLFAPKTLGNFKKYDKEGEHQVENISFDDNLIIKGNNLLALHSLKNKYMGKVKLIYIDPPYNTRNDGFGYNDSFNHSTWLTFMKNRLEVAKELLTPKKGVIAISIDHNEAFYLKILCDEIFGRENFISSVTVQNNPKGRVMDKNFSTSNEYLIFYSKGELEKELSIRKTDNEIKKNYPEKDKDGHFFRFLELRNTHREFGKHNRKNLFFPLWVCPNDQSVSIEKTALHSIEVFPLWGDDYEGCWTWGTTKCQIESDLLVGRKINNKWKIYRKGYSTNKDGNNVSKQLKTIWFSKDFHTDKGQKSIDEILGKGIFKSPKPISYIKTIIDLATDSHDGDIILDFFSGSGTTAQALIELNKEDSGNRKYILCEQMDYAKDITVKRINLVLKRDHIDSSFIYGELTQHNDNIIDKIKKVDTTESLKTIWQEIEKKDFISYKINPEIINENIHEFESLTIVEQKQFLISVLDKNQLYVNYSDIEDEDYQVSDDDKKLNRQFYGEV